jgi:hypothetical protein
MIHGITGEKKKIDINTKKKFSPRDGKRGGGMIYGVLYGWRLTETLNTASSSLDSFEVSRCASV